MSAVTLGTSYSVRTVAKTAPILLNNMVLEADDANLVDGKMRIQRPALTTRQVVGAGPIYAVFSRKGVLNGDMIVVSGTGVYRVPAAVSPATPSLGTVASGPAQVTGGETGILLCDGGGNVYSYDGTTFAAVAMPDGVLVSSVAYLSGYYYLIEQNSQRIYYIEPGNTAPGGLDFFSAESLPDNALAMDVLADELWIFGQSSIEIWAPSGDQDAPLTRINSRLYNHGIAARDTLRYADNTLFFVGDDRIAYRAETVPKAISDNPIGELLRQADPLTLRAWVFTLDGHVYYVLSFNIAVPGSTTEPPYTVVYDVTTGSWSYWNSYGDAGGFRASFGTQIDGSLAIGGDTNSGTLFTMDATKSADDGTPIVREIVGGVPISGSPIRCDSLTVCAAMGQSANGAMPAKLQVRWSDDQGQTWSEWREMSLGTQGNYAGVATIRMLGRMVAPGRIFHFRTSDPALARISYARVNEAFG